MLGSGTATGANTSSWNSIRLEISQQTLPVQPIGLRGVSESESDVFAFADPNGSGNPMVYPVSKIRTPIRIT